MVIPENEKTKVVFSSLFERHYPKLALELSNIMRPYHKVFRALSYTKDYWVRDFMPIQVNENVFIKFVYNPDYLQNQKSYISDVDRIIKKCPFAQDFEIVDVPLVVDGGNMVFCKGMKNKKETQYVVMTEKIFNENPEFCKWKLELILKSVFQNTNLIIVWLPWDRKDTFGHTDGILKYIGKNDSGRPEVLVNLELYDNDIATRMYSALSKHFDVVELKLSKYEDLSWAYINSLQTRDFIIIPGLGDAITDSEVLAQYKHLFPQYGNHIYQVQMREFIAENGGALNCITWTLKEDIWKN